MKIWSNVLIFLFVLCLPFALSSQTRKGIPAGRYEALSGVKVSHTSKNDSAIVPNTQNNFWGEVLKNLPENKVEISIVKKNVQDINLTQLLPSKKIQDKTAIDSSVDLFITNTIANKDELKKLKNKSLIVMIANTTVKDQVSNLSNYEIITFMAGQNENYFLLKAK